MKYVNDRAENVKIAYIGGGSRGWAWGLMSDLVSCGEMSGEVLLYDIDWEAAKQNEIIGNAYKECEEAKSIWNYRAVAEIGDALRGADFVIISILPGTFDEMASDVHTPEKYGIYQSVGDTTGPGGIIRAMRTIPMYEEIAENIRRNCPNAWVISYTNPMTLCVKTLYRVFPEIKAFGCCHEVFGTQELLRLALKDICNIDEANRNRLQVNPVGVNHFTWFTKAQYRNIDLFEIYTKFVEKYAMEGWWEKADNNWMNNSFASAERVKMDLFKRYGYIAAAGDRHLAEFCDGDWYLKNPETVKEWKFNLTTVDWRKADHEKRLEKSKRLVSKEQKIEITNTGEEGVNQMKALLGLGDLVTNVNIPNVGQIPNLPMGAIVETNAAFRTDSVTPVMAGIVPQAIYPLVSRICNEQELLSEAVATRDVGRIFEVFAKDPLVTCSYDDAKKLFGEMLQNTRKYLTIYDLTGW